MEIIHLILGKANPNRMNGVNKVVYQLVTHQVKKGKRASVWGITKDLSHNYGERNFETKLFQQHKNLFKIDSKLKDALNSLKENNVIIHFHGGWVPIYFSLAKFLKKHKITFVLTPHGAYNVIAMQRSGFTKKIYFNLFESTVIKNSKYIHSLGQSEVDGYLKLCNQKDKSKLIPYGFDYQIRKRVENQQEKFIIGFVGRIDVYTKGLDLLLDAFKTFSSKNPSSELWIIGDGAERKELAEKYKSCSSIIFLGSKYEKEKDDLIAQMHLFAHPSRNEGLPTAVIEAATFYVPSIVTYATNFGDYIRDYNAGYVVDNDSESDLLKGLEYAMIEFQENKLCQKGENAFRMVQEEFDWNKIVDKFDELYC
jgi:glycosyltransferase involved in cell wall biosynthesis